MWELHLIQLGSKNNFSFPSISSKPSERQSRVSANGNSYEIKINKKLLFDIFGSTFCPEHYPVNHFPIFGLDHKNNYG